MLSIFLKPLNFINNSAVAVHNNIGIVLQSPGGVNRRGNIGYLKLSGKNGRMAGAAALVRNNPGNP